MSYKKNVAGQKLVVTAVNQLTNAKVTGDAANISCRVSKDGGASAASNDVNPTELDATNHKGVYIFDLSQAETNCDIGLFTPSSSTANVVLDQVIIYPGVDVVSVGGTGQTAGDLAAELGKVPKSDGTVGWNSTARGQIQTEVEEGVAVYDPPTNAEMEARTLTSASYATASQINSLAINTRANLHVPVEIETPDAGTQVYKIRLHLFDVEGNMEIPDSTPTIALTNAAGTDRSSRLSVATNPSGGVYTWDYTATAAETEEQLVWVFTVVEGGLTRTYPATSYVVEHSAYRFSSADRATLNNAATAAELAKVPKSDGAVGWNTTARGQIQTEVEEGITVYDPPTNAEMMARTLVAASYATSAVCTEGRLAELDAANLPTDIAAVKTDTGNLVIRITSTLFTGITSLAQWLGLIGAKHVGNTTARTEMNATGAGSGTFNEVNHSTQAIRDRGDVAWVTGGGNSGTGARVITGVVNDGAAALENATVRYTEGVNTFTTTTNASGQFTPPLNLNDATYTVSIAKSGYTFAGTTHVVSANSSPTYSMTAIVITPPVAPANTTLYFTLLTEAGVAASGVTVYFRMKFKPAGYGIMFDDDWFTAVSSGSGLVQATNMFKGATYEIGTTQISARPYKIPTDAGSTHEMPNMVT